MEKQYSENFPKVTLSDSNKTVTVNGENIHVPPSCFKILRTLIQAEGAVVDRLQLLEIIWGTNELDESALTTRAVDVAVSKLRNEYKIKERIETKSHYGYRWAK